MAPDEAQDSSPDATYWRANTRLIVLLTLIWAVVSFAPALLPRDLGLTVFGAPLSFWIAAQGAPLVYVLIVWFYERRMDRLDRERRARGNV
jgi:putative solute:sodium symporter small subunit